MAAPGAPVRLANGQFIGQPGSNGGVHRRRDRFPRRNVIRAMFLNALGSQEMRPSVDPRTGRIVFDADGKPLMIPSEPTQMVKDNVAAYRLISQRAALGNGIDQRLRMMKDGHDILKETKAEGPEGPHPVPARFVLSDGTELVPPGEETTPPEPPTGIEKDVQMYEEAE